MEGKCDNNEMTTGDPMYHWERLQETQRKKLKLLQEETEKIQNEKDTMNAVVATANISDDDIIEIDAGGRIIRALRSTLTQVPDTMFTFMFSGRWEESLKRNSHGHVFLDHDPELIEIIVNFLRTKKIENHALPVQSLEIPDKKKNQFKTVLHYFGLTDFFYPPSIFVPLDINNMEVVQSQGSAISVNKSENKIQISQEYSNGQFNFVTCKPPLDSSGEGSFWKVTIDAVSNDGDGILLGITGTLDASFRSSTDPTSCGWIGGTSPNRSTSAVYINGNCQTGHGGWSSGGFIEGECLYFHLKSNKLTMFSVKKNQTFTMDVGTTVDAYYIRFNMYYSGTTITLEPLNEEESARLL